MMVSLQEMEAKKVALPLILATAGILFLILGLQGDIINLGLQYEDNFSFLIRKHDPDTVCLLGKLSQEQQKTLQMLTQQAKYYHFNLKNRKKPRKLTTKDGELFTDNCDMYYIDNTLTTTKDFRRLQLFANPNNFIIMEKCQSNRKVLESLIKDKVIQELKPITEDGLCYLKFVQPERNLQQILRVIKGKTMVGNPKNKYLYKQIQSLDKRGIEGDIVECGVWKGGTSLFMALSTTKDRTLWLYDTYEGHTGEYEVGKDDVKLINKWKSLNHLQASIHYDWHTFKDKNGTVHWTEAGTELVSHTMKLAGKKHYLIKGRVEDTLREKIPDKIAILRLDTDFYSPTKTELEVLFPRLVPGGVIVIDDYCQYKGSRTATNEYLRNNTGVMCSIIKKGSLCFNAIKCNRRKN